MRVAHEAVVSALARGAMSDAISAGVDGCAEALDDHALGWSRARNQGAPAAR